MAGGFTSTPEARRHHIRQYGSLTANNGLGESPSRVNERKGLLASVDYCSFAYSALACSRMGMSGSASFQRVRKSWYAARAFVTSP
jgi:hypothetical protein